MVGSGSRTLSATEWNPRIATSSGSAFHPRRGSSVSTSASVSLSGPLKYSRASLHGKRGPRHLARAALAGFPFARGEMGHHGPGRAIGIAVIEMIDLRIVEVHRDLHAPEAQPVHEESVVLCRGTGEGCDVVQSGDMGDHRGILLVAARARIHK